MKILTAQQLREADLYTIQHEPIASIDLMERAALKCTDWITNNYTNEEVFSIFCGIGNNGGDGLAIARQLKLKGYNVEVFVVLFSEKYSADFKSNINRLEKVSISAEFIQDENSFPSINPKNIIVDAIFGTGLNQPVKGFVGKIIDLINNLNQEVISIDLPSGLFASSNTQNDGSIIKANHTLTFQAPKLSFMFRSSAFYVGEWEVLDIGLSEEFVESLKVTTICLSENRVKSLIKKRSKFDHKGTYGHGLIIAGSFGKVGAAVLATKAMLRSGVGLSTVMVPDCGYSILQTSCPEAMCLTHGIRYISGKINDDLKQFNAIGIGPGLDQHSNTIEFLTEFLQSYNKPLVIDADALNILAQRKDLWHFVPEFSILTPHPKEFDRLFDSSSSDEERLDKLKYFSTSNNWIILLKGAHSAIALPDGTLYFNSTGNPGMATGGSGDVLTGLITGLLAQGYTSIDAAIIGTYIHGLAGDLASEMYSEIGMNASDIINQLPEAFQHVI